MKIQIMIAAVISVVAMAGTNKTIAQGRAGIETKGPVASKKEPVKMMIAMDNHLTNPGTIHPKALRDFADTYKNATGEVWMTTKDGFAVRFSSEGTRITVFYDRKGRWFGSIKNYGEEKLPGGVRNIVRSQYYDYSIFYVEEVKSVLASGSPTYIIHLEDKVNIKLVRVNDGEMEVWKEYKKA